MNCGTETWWKRLWITDASPDIFITVIDAEGKILEQIDYPSLGDYPTYYFLSPRTYHPHNFPLVYSKEFEKISIRVKGKGTTMVKNFKISDYLKT